MLSACSVWTSLIQEKTSECREVLERYSLADDHIRETNPQSILARALLRKRLSALTDTEAARWTFGRGENSRPLAYLDGMVSPLAVSISHSGPYIATAIAHAEAIGIDIEMHREWRDLGDIAAFAFGPNEQKSVAAHGPDAFYRIWTLREALSKATGLGLQEAADGQDRFPAPFTEGLLSELEETDRARYRYCGYRLASPGLSCAVAIKYGAKPHYIPEWLWEQHIRTDFP